jgi:hypothetical protein
MAAQKTGIRAVKRTGKGTVHRTGVKGQRVGQLRGQV